MSAYAGSSSSRPGDVVGTLRLLAYLALAIVLMLADHNSGWLARMRLQAENLVQPLWWVAGAPARIGAGMRETALTRERLAQENRMLRNALLISGARVARLQAAADENERIRGLLRAAQGGRLDVQLVSILDIDLDPSRQRLMLDAGSRDGVRMGQSVIDAGGLLGQIIAVTPSTATVLLLTDPGHAVPVQVARSGVRLVAYGNGRSDQLTLANVPLSSDIKVGDSIITSGLGQRFIAGFAVGQIVALRPDESRAFLTGHVKPAARLDRGRDVLLLRNQTPRVPASAAAASLTAEPAAKSTAALGTRAHAAPMPQDLSAWPLPTEPGTDAAIEKRAR